MGRSELTTTDNELVRRVINEKIYQLKSRIANMVTPFESDVIEVKALIRIEKNMFRMKLPVINNQPKRKKKKDETYSDAICCDPNFPCECS